MRIACFLNRNAGGAEQLADLLHRRKEMTVFEPCSAEDTLQQVKQAAAAGYDLVAAAGGDGTVHTVLNGLAPEFGRTALGIIPLGTGNDLRRTLAIPEDPLEAIDLLNTGQQRPLDVVRVQTPTRTLYCLNVSAGGFAGKLEEKVTTEAKQAWGPLAYLGGVAGAAAELPGYHTTLALEGAPGEGAKLLNVLLANARYAAGGYLVAPRANPEDGLLDVILIRHAPLLDLAAVAAQLLIGDYTCCDVVECRQARQARIDSTPAMSYSIDGELLPEERVISFTVLPRVLRVVVGPNYTPVPAES